MLIGTRPELEALSLCSWCGLFRGAAGLAGIAMVSSADLHDAGHRWAGGEHQPQPLGEGLADHAGDPRSRVEHGHRVAAQPFPGGRGQLVGALREAQWQEPPQQHAGLVEGAE